MIKEEVKKEILQEQYEQEFQDWKNGNLNELYKEFAEEHPSEFEEFAWEQYKVLTS